MRYLGFTLNKFMSKTLKKARILSSENDASIKLNQSQDTLIDLSITPPVNFPMGAMENQQTMAPPMKTSASAPFVPIQPEEPIISRSTGPNQSYLRSVPIHPTQVSNKSSQLPQMDGQLEQTSPAETIKQLPSQTKERPASFTVKNEQRNIHTERSVKTVSETEHKMDNNPAITSKHTNRQRLWMRRTMLERRNKHVHDVETAGEAPVEENIEQKPENDILTIDELKQPEEMQSVQPVVNDQQEHERLQNILNEKTKRAGILEAMLEIYENKHQCINDQLVCRQQQLEELVRAYTGAERVEIIANPRTCGCFGQAPKIMDIDNIFVSSGGKTYELKYAFNDAYADMLRHGISLKQVFV